MTRNENRTADSVTKIVLLIFRSIRRALIEIAPGIEKIVAVELVHVAVEAAGAGLDLGLHGARSIASILRAVVRSQHADFGDGVNAGENVQRIVAAVIHVVAAVHFPVVVLASSAVDAVNHVAQNSYRAFILLRLVIHAGG